MGSKASIKNGELLLPLRIVVRRPPPGVRFALQKGKSDADGNADLAAPSKSSADSLSFDFSVRVPADRTGGVPRFLGEFTQGSPTQRFVYLNSGKRAGQSGTHWDRRAKIPLTGITTAMIDAVQGTPGTVLELEILGTAGDGGPVCASRIDMIGGGWHPTPSN
jgi:hypothetical protein